jgi:hypothetical protein
MDLNNIGENFIRGYIGTTQNWGGLGVTSERNTYPGHARINLGLSQGVSQLDTSNDRCLCGCGQIAKSRYLMGHDATHASRLAKQYARSESSDERDIALANILANPTAGISLKVCNRLGIQFLADPDYERVAINKRMYLVIKIGRWVYPVIQTVDGGYWRSPAIVTESFLDCHDFNIALDPESDEVNQVVSMLDLYLGQKAAANLKEKEGVTA